MKSLKYLCMLLILMVIILFMVDASAYQIGEKQEEVSSANPEGKAQHVSADLPLMGKTIFLDPGHGIGAAGGGYYEGYEEHVYNLILADALKESLQKLGATVIMTRVSSENVENIARMAMVNKYALTALKSEAQAAMKESTNDVRAMLLENIAEITRLEGVMQSVLDNPTLAQTYFNSPYDYTYSKKIHSDLKEIFELENTPLLYENMLILSIHTNATPQPVDTSINGTVTYYLTNDWRDSQNYYINYINVQKDKRIAELLADMVSNAGGFYNNGAQVNDFFMLRESNLPAVLVEVGYHTNAEDRQKITDPNCQKRIVQGMASAVLQYFSEIETGREDAIKGAVVGGNKLT